MGTTYYVDAQNGDDGNSGQSAVFQGGNAGPWKTISKVNGFLFAPGDSILFRRGAVWTDGPLEPQTGGAPGDTITVQETILGQPISFGLVDPQSNNCLYFGAYGDSPDKPRIDCQGGRGIILLHDYIIVEGLHLDNGGNNMLWLNRDEGTRWIIIKNVDVTHCGANAVRFSQGGGNIWLQGVYVYDYGVNGILLNGSPDNLLKHVLVEDCWVENPATADLEDAITCHQHDNTYDLEGSIIIRNNTILRAGEDGIDVTSGTNILLDGNDIRYSFSAGILISKPWVNTIEVRNNFLYSNSSDQGNGDLSIRANNVWAYNNVIAGNGHNCLSISDTDNTKIWNNVIAPMNRTGNFIRFTENVGNVELKNNIFDFSLVDQEIYGTITPNIVFDNNCYFGVSPDQDVHDNLSFQEYRNANPLFEPNGFWGDPQFVGPGRDQPELFRLAAASPCIDRGADVPVLQDFWGTPRPLGSQIDIGIYEHGVDCNPDPNITSFPGDPCDDGDPTTAGDAINANCECAGTPTACTGIGDADGDGVCADVDCDDNDPNIAYQPGDACDDGDPNTTGETIQSNCNCGGGTPVVQTILACSRISQSEDDAEEHDSGYVSLTSSDLELANDPGRGLQSIGLRFSGLGIPQGATILSATVQFTVDDDANDNPCMLTISGEAAGNPGSFIAAYQNISTRPRTSASVQWAPAEWQNVGDAGAPQQTPDISAVVQEIVNRNGYSANSPIVLFIGGNGRRVAESFDGSSSGAPELCVEYTSAPIAFDCPALQANIGDACDDGDNTTINDTIDANCACAGTPTACTGIGDNDGDGLCADVDCDDNDPAIAYQSGDACDDGDNTTINDIIDANCTCAGTPTACTGIGDNDGDGLCADVDCDDNDPAVTSQPGDACDDGDNTTINDTIGANCNCAGTPTACTGIGDNDGDGLCADVDCDDNDPAVTTFDADGDGLCSDIDCDDSDATVAYQPGDTCDDGDNTTVNDIIGADCACAGMPTDCTGAGDNDGDGVCADIDCDDNDPAITTMDADGDGICSDVDCDDNDPAITTRPGDACDDGDNTTINDTISANCACAGTPTACTGIGDADGDGVCADVDCDDNDPAITTLDADGDGLCSDVDCDDSDATVAYQPGDTCDDGDNTTINDTIGADCACAGTPTACTGIGDNDGDGVCADVDCDDNDPAVVGQPGSSCDDGNPNTINDVIDSNCNCAGVAVPCPGVGDADGDGLCADVDCDDSDPGIAHQPGDACNDGNPNTIGETIQADCSCGGGSTGMAPILTCDRVDGLRDDAEEQPSGQIRLASNDLELINDANSGNQVVGLRFGGLRIPRGAYIVSARLQFTAESPNNDNPADLTIYGEASGTPLGFRGSGFNLSSRPRTNAMANWLPSEWTAAGQAGFAQQSPDLSPIIQEIIRRAGYASSSAIVLLIEGTGRRAAESYEGFAARAPQLCVEYLIAPPNFDCPERLADFGAPCDDGNPGTYNDQVDANCNCAGTPAPCPGIGDNDGDGVCADTDCDDNDPAVTYQPGDACDDGNPGTIGETIQPDCSCGGGSPAPALSCARIAGSSDDAVEAQSGQVALTGSKLELAGSSSQGSQLVGLRFSGLDIPRGARILRASLQFTVADTQNESLCELRIYGEASDNARSFAGSAGDISRRPATNASVEWMPSEWQAPGTSGHAQQSPDLSAVLQEIVGRGGYASSSAIAIMIDGVGRRAAQSFDGSASEAPVLCVEYLPPAPVVPRSGGAAAPETSTAGALLVPPARQAEVLENLSVYPNPATDRLTAAFTSAAEGPARIQAVDMNGKAVLVQERDIHKGENAISLESLSLPEGIYVLQVISGSSVQSVKFIIVSE